MEGNINQTAELIANDFEMQTFESPYLTEEELLNALSVHIDEMMKYRMEIGRAHV